MYVLSPPNSLLIIYFLIPFSYHNLPNNCYLSINDVEAGLDKLKILKLLTMMVYLKLFIIILNLFSVFPLWMIFRHLLDEDCFRSMWKIKATNLIYKTRHKSDISKYRAILIQYHLTKFFEPLILRIAYR